MGQVYVEISASVVNEMMGISTLDGSGTGGSETVSVNIYWGDGGFTGLGWYFDETPLEDWWSTVYSGDNDYVSGVTYSNDEDGFKNWISMENPKNLDAALGKWSNDAKIVFLKKYPVVFTTCAL